jgi:hypothetical protein
VARWVNSSTIVNDTPEIILEMESWIYRRLRHFQMLTNPIDGTMVIGQNFIPSPSDMLEPFLLWTTGQYQQILTQVTPQQLIAAWEYTGTGSQQVQQQPTLYYLGQGQLNLDSPPDQAYDYNLMYYQQPAPLAETNTNFLTQTYPRLVRLACMAQAAEWMKDSGQGNYDRMYWDNLAEAEIDRAQAESDRARRGTVAGMILIGGGGYVGQYPGLVVGY